MHRLQLETLGHLSFLGMILEVFGPGFSAANLTRRRTEGDTSVDTLTPARQLFPVNAHLAWVTVSAFWQAWRLRTVEAVDRRGGSPTNGFPTRDVDRRG
ncbi:hypothetical protein [Amycolatopsis sp. NPDC051903]|uniref:hypothetical protein n=1 Tax=Amycolatopsis sp. NPDC051903 TaxID=3363936 RepID=UPI003795CDE8